MRSGVLPISSIAQSATGRAWFLLGRPEESCPDRVIMRSAGDQSLGVELGRALERRANGGPVLSDGWAHVRARGGGGGDRCRSRREEDGADDDCCEGEHTDGSDPSGG